MDYLNENVNNLLLSCEENLEKAVNFVKNEFMLIRAGRVNTGIVDRITVDYFGTPTPLKNLANMNAADSRTLVVNLWDTSIIRDVCKAILQAQIGANPIDDGRVIRLIFPLLTEERRKELVKHAKKITEEGKVTMRNARRDALDALKKFSKSDNISEDEQKSIEADIQKLTDTYTKTLDTIFAKKEQEIMEI